MLNCVVATGTARALPYEGRPSRKWGGPTSMTSEALCPQCPGPSLKLVFLQFLETWVPAHRPCHICMCLSGRKVNCTSQPCPTARGERPHPCCSWRKDHSLEPWATLSAYLVGQIQTSVSSTPPAHPSFPHWTRGPLFCTWSRYSERLILPSLPHLYLGLQTQSLLEGTFEGATRTPRGDSFVRGPLARSLVGLAGRARAGCPQHSEGCRLQRH